MEFVGFERSHVEGLSAVFNFQMSSLEPSQRGLGYNMYFALDLRRMV
jgi:hypothetical protein